MPSAAVPMPFMNTFGLSGPVCGGNSGSRSSFTPTPHVTPPSSECFTKAVEPWPWSLPESPGVGGQRQ